MRLVPALPALFLCACAALAAAPHQTSWEIREFTWVKLAPREPGAPVNEHPAALDLQALRRNLAGLRIGDEALFETKELEGLLRPLQEALSLAGPDEDVLLLSTNRRGGGFMNTAFGVTARLFVQGGKVNLIVHDARMDFVDRVRARELTPVFKYGSRSGAGPVVLTGSGLASRRPDWVTFPVVQASAAAEASEAGAASGEDLEKRLRTLKRLRDENLISEEEFQAKRKAILGSL